MFELSQQDAIILGNKYNLEVDDFRDLNLVKEIHNKPKSLIFKVHKHLMKNEEYFMFKVFHDHLKISQLKELLEFRLNKIIILKRRPIDMFISLCKAQKLKKFSYVDTTDLKIKIDTKRFLKYHFTIKKSYELYKKLSLKHKGKINIIDYDEFKGFKEDETYLILKNKLTSIGINLNPDFNTSSKFFKQEKELLYASKVVNWETFFKDITKKESLNKLYNF